MKTVLSLIEAADVDGGVIENVPGFRQRPPTHSRSALEIFQAKLTEMGYAHNYIMVCQSMFAPCARNRCSVEGSQQGKRRCSPPNQKHVASPHLNPESDHAPPVHTVPPCERVYLIFAKKQKLVEEVFCTLKDCMAHVAHYKQCDVGHFMVSVAEAEVYWKALRC